MLKIFLINGTQKHVYISVNKSLFNDDGENILWFYKVAGTHATNTNEVHAHASINGLVRRGRLRE